MSQLELRPTDWNAVWQEFRQLFRRIVDIIGTKQVAYDLDVAPSQLLNALEERDRNLPAKWLPYLLVNAPAELGDMVLSRLAALRGCEVVEAPTLKPAEELADLKAALADCLGLELRQAIMAKAKRRRR